MSHDKYRNRIFGHDLQKLIIMLLAVLLAKLEERFVLGEISEETYNKLREKYKGDEG